MAGFSKSSHRVRMLVDPRPTASRGQSPLAQAAGRITSWLSQGAPPGIERDQVLFVLPSARAGRRFSYHVTQTTAVPLRPGQIITPGELIERIVEVAPCNEAPELIAFAWERALEELPTLEHGTLPAQSVQALVSLRNDLSAAGFDIKSICSSPALMESLPARVRELFTESLAPIEESFERTLTRLGLADRWMTRRAALSPLLGTITTRESSGDELEPSEFEGRISWRNPTRCVVLVGCIELSPLLQLVLRAYPGTIVALTFAAEEKSHDWFDTLGTLKSPTTEEQASEFERSFIPGPFDLFRIRELSEVAHQTLSILPAEQPGSGALDSTSASDASLPRRSSSYDQSFDQVSSITLGLPVRAQRHLLVELINQLAIKQSGNLPSSAQQPLIRDGSGRPFAESRLIQFFIKLLVFQSTSLPDSLQSLLRCARLWGVLSSERATILERDLDNYVHHNLPVKICSADAPGCQEAHQWITALRGVLDSKAVFPASVEELRALFWLEESPPPALPLDSFEDQVFQQLCELHKQISRPTTEAHHNGGAHAHDVPQELLQQCISKLSSRVHEPRGNVPRIEVLGWLELYLDEAPRLLVVDPTLDVIPGSSASSPFLGERMRELLRLPTSVSRGFRDRYRWWLTTNSSRHVSVLLQQVGARGEPLVLSPAISPLGDPVRCAAMFDTKGLSERAGPVSLPNAAPPTTAPTTALAKCLPKAAKNKRSWPAPSSVSVSAVGDYLVCPYRFALRHLEGLQSMPDTALEYDGAQFGSLLHSAIDAAVKQELSVAEFRDAASLERFLLAQLEQLARPNPANGRQPASLIQLESAGARLKAYAQWHCSEREVGWRPISSEFPFKLATQAGLVISGRIDRVERKGNQVRLIDIKTSEKAEQVDRFHRRSLRSTTSSSSLMSTSTWSSLQLPIYRLGWLASQPASAFTEQPELGLLFLTGAAEVIYHRAAWTAEDYSDASEALEAAARGISSGTFWPPRPAEELPFDPFPFVSFLVGEAA